MQADDADFELAHIGINADNEEQAGQIAQILCKMFNFQYQFTPDQPLK